MQTNYRVAIVGAGPAGLTAAYELAKQGIHLLVVERDDKVGGIARTEIYKGYRFDIGGHRFYTKVGEVQQLWLEVLGDEFIQVPRLSRIYYRGKFFDYPLSFANTLSNLGLGTSAAIVLSYIKAKIQAFIKRPEPETFEEWVTHCFGRRLYETFFKTYTEKVWGIPCNKISAEWAIQRIKGLSLKQAVINALFGTNNTKTLIKKFDYPILGPGMMWERFTEAVEKLGGDVWLDTGVIRVKHHQQRIESMEVDRNGEVVEVKAEHFISSMPVTALVRCLDPRPPEPILEAARSLKYRAFIIVALIIDAPNLFPDNWIYIHSPEVTVGRIQNFKNWSPAMVPDPNKTCLGMEYFCDEGDDLWNLSNEKLLELATKEIGILGLAKSAKVEDGTVLRQPKAYPVYDRNYRQHLQVLQDYLAGFDNLQTVGRNGMHRYNNQDHSMLTGLLAAKNIIGEKHDLWQVNVERSYYEDFTQEEWEKRQKSLSKASREVMPDSL
ncbi:NAD(P)/FAD-dependent oxidoreductase [Oscillatoria sp. FACHB-1406]|uniref:NAD(P)/FAD-dependent oxidoreductase n=1 Tax=Oscillatoria sp. FACHB-1406 TaxID=2692846 RepID=UPI001684B5F7|nr:NAD(P)/FAD-dependent oxidoreductase [Oscillatoria sp. FACHB-1406]MBD2578577.1 NAD(P)/FAD-dependent oxidoreductase [Oscillatoria sp. FACHB-1406]